jgi:hypothetical protein
MNNLIQNYELILDRLQKTYPHIECIKQIRKLNKWCFSKY